MRLSTLIAATALAVGSIGFASATPVNLIQNGSFAQTNNGTSVPTQFGDGSRNGFTAQQFITHWTGNDGYEIWYPSTSAAQNVNAIGEWTSTGKEKLYGPITAPQGTQTFVGLDGDQSNGVQSSIGQNLTSLVVGASYTVTFDWAAAQLQSRTGDTKTWLQIFFGNQSYTMDPPIQNPSGSFTGWETTSLYFTANSKSAFLNFLAFGTPSGYPPVALLTNVSVIGPQAVPEPPEMAMFGIGLLGLGLLTVVARRRALRRDGADDGDLA